MSLSKYVVGEIDCSGIKILTAIVIPKYMRHDSIKDAFIPDSIRSAGFFLFTQEQIFISGCSTSLKKGVNREDCALIGRTIGHPAYKT